MTNVLLYNKKSNVTAKVLAKALNLRAVRDDRLGNVTNPVVKVRWGTSANVFGDTCEYNSQRAISLASHGVHMLHQLANGGVYCPTPLTANEVNTQLEGKVFLARQLNHRGGLDIQFVANRLDFQTAVNMGYRFFVEFVHTSLELRVHVFNGTILKAFKKVNGGDQEESIYPIRTSYRGWEFRRVDIAGNYPKAIPVAIKAVEALGLKFGAVDMAWDVAKKEWIVWEVNSAPALNTETLKLYVEKLKEVL